MKRLSVVLLFFPVANATFSLSGCQSTFESIVANDSFDISGLRGLYGERVQNYSQAFGFNYDVCIQVCGEGWDPANITDITNNICTWFLPYFSLFAQIPLQGDDLYGDLQALVYTIGSPLTGLYSMFLSHFNWIWLGDYFNSVIPPDADDNTVNDILQVVGKMQQFPVGPEFLNPELLAWALLDPRNAKWWQALAKRLAARERKLDGPAVAQMGFAILAYILSVLTALDQIGDESTPLGMAIGNVFWWLIPLVWGWYGISTINGRIPETTELLHNEETPLYTGELVIEGAAIFSLVEQTKYGMEERDTGEEQELPLLTRMHGSEIASTYELQTWQRDGLGEAHRDETMPAGIVEGSESENENDSEVRQRANASKDEENTILIRAMEIDGIIQEVPETTPSTRARKWVKFSSQPDRKRLGPFYNFARFEDWTQLTEVIADAYGTVLRRDQEAPVTHESLLQQIHSKLAVVHPSRIFWWRQGAAFVCAFLVYGAACWSSFMIAYETVTSGLGCRSTGFLISFGFSIVVYLCLTLASHFGQRSTDNSHRRRKAEITFRKLGKALALFNCLILFGNCMLQFTGVYSTCYCQSDKIGLGSNAHMTFLNADLTAEISQRFWWGGFGMAIGTSLFAIALVEWTRWKLANRKNTILSVLREVGILADHGSPVV